MKNIIMCFNFDKSPIIKDIRIGLTVPLLPLEVGEFYNSLKSRLFRLFGGICVVLHVSKYYSNFDLCVIYIIIITSVIYIGYTLIISGIKVVFGFVMVKYKNKYLLHEFTSIILVYIVLILRILFIFLKDVFGLVGFLFSDQIFEIVSCLCEIRKSIQKCKK